METKTMSIDVLEEKMKEEEGEIGQKNEIKYDDNYISNQNNAYFSFHFVSTLLASNLDYSETNWTQFDSIDSLKNKLRNELDINYVTSIQQRHCNVILQHPFINIQFPKFTDLIPQRAKSSKKCRNCKKLVIQAGDVSSGKALDTKLEIAHLFLLQFPYISIFRIDTSMKVLMLKFSVLDYKEITISFREDIDSPIKVILPPGKYEIGTNKEYEQNKYFYSKSDKFVVFNFQIAESHHSAIEVNGSCHLVRFIIKSEYNRGGSETAKDIEYPIEIKFKVSIN